jgi:hypothetical protein
VYIQSARFAIQNISASTKRLKYSTGMLSQERFTFNHRLSPALFFYFVKLLTVIPASPATHNRQLSTNELKPSTFTVSKFSKLFNNINYGKVQK